MNASSSLHEVSFQGLSKFEYPALGTLSKIANNCASRLRPAQPRDSFEMMRLGEEVQ